MKHVRRRPIPRGTLIVVALLSSAFADGDLGSTAGLIAIGAFVLAGLMWLAEGVLWKRGWYD